jgi:alpha-2-macroglobulin
MSLFTRLFKNKSEETLPLPTDPSTPSPFSPVHFLETSNFLLKLVVLSLILIFEVFTLFALNGGFNTQKSQLSDYSNYLHVVRTWPSEQTADTRPSIMMQFNHSVVAHHVSEYFEMYPWVDGEFVQGSGSDTVIFVPKENFKTGVRVYIRLKEGLISDEGKKLISPYTFSFAIGADARSMSFKNGYWSGKFLSFQKSLGADVTVSVGADVRKPRVKIYKATPELLLNSLTYKSVLQKSGTYEYSTVEYEEKEIDTSKLILAEEHTYEPGDTNLHFTGDNGIYLFQAMDGEGVIKNAWVSLNDTGIHFRQDDQKIFLAAQNLETGEPTGDIKVTFYQLGNKSQVLAQHTLSGIQEYPFEFSDRLDLILAQKGKDYMIIPVKIPNSQAEISVSEDLQKKHQIFLYTDRPIYKKGDQVLFRGLVRVDNDGVYQMPKEGTQVRIYTYGYENKPSVIDKVVTVGTNGTFAGDFKITEDLSATQYLYASTNLDKTSSYSSSNTYFDVIDYVKPPFGLEAQIDKSEYIRGDVAKVSVSGTYFNGKPLANEKVSYTLYARDYYETEKTVYNSSFKLNNWGGMCGGGFGFGDEWYGTKIGETKEITLDANGKANLEIQTKDLENGTSKELTVLVDKTDSNNNKIVSAKNAIVHQGEANIFLRRGANSVARGQNYLDTFSIESLNGQSFANTQVSYELFQEKWDDGKTTRTTLKSGSVTTNSDGVGVIRDSMSVAEDVNNVLLSVYTKDSRGNKVEATKYYYVISPAQADTQNLDPWGPSLLVLRIVAQKDNLKPGQPGSLNIEAPADMTVLTSFERGRVYNPQWLKLQKGSNTFNFDVPDIYMPSITPTFSMFYKGQYDIEGLSLNVPAMKKLITVEVSTDKPQYNLGDTALVTIFTKDADNNAISADVGVAIVDKAIFAIRKNATPPIHSSFYFFRPRQTNSSSSLTWIAEYEWGGKGGGGGEDELFQKDADTLYWNPKLKTGTDGRVTVQVPVYNTETTWRVLGYASTDDTKIGQGQLDFVVAR